VSLYVSWTVQVAILALGIYVFLRFLRTTRGGGLLRGLMLTMLFGVVGLWGLAEVAQLEELSHIFQRITPYLAVILAIVFQPELRRAMAQLGEQNRFGRFLRTRRNEAVSEVTQAAVAMAARRHGALIAFQRDIGLDAYTQNAVKLDSQVNRLLIESLFHPGGALHDGAAVVIGDRLAAAACLFPLTERADLSGSTGTRHRAAIGVTEESDAVALIVSEETGAISIAHRGLLERDVKPERLEASLRRRLGEAEETGAAGDLARRKPSPWARVAHAFRVILIEDLPRKAASIALASALIFLASSEIATTQTVFLQVMSGEQARRSQGERGVLAVRLPEEHLHLVRPRSGDRVTVEISGPRREIERIQFQLSGVLDLASEKARTGVTDVSVDDVRWLAGDERIGPAVTFDWADRPPRLELQRYTTRDVVLRPEHVTVDKSGLDGHYTALVNKLDFSPATIEVVGPEAVIAILGSEELPFRLSPMMIPTGERGPVVTAWLNLDDALRELGLAFSEGTRITVVLPIEPAVRELEAVELEVPVIDLAVGKNDADLWTLPITHQKVPFRIRTAGIFPADALPGAPLYNQLSLTIRQFVQDELVLFVDVSGLDLESELSSAPLHYFLPRDWRTRLGRDLARELGPEAELTVELSDESYREIRLDRVRTPDAPEVPSNGPSNGD
jgi:diadenylate cyclase